MNTNYMLITNGNDIWKGQVKNSWSKQALKEEKPVWIHQNCFDGFIKPIPILSNKLTPTNTPSTHPKKKKKKSCETGNIFIYFYHNYPIPSQAHTQIKYNLLLRFSVRGIQSLRPLASLQEI